MQRVAVLSDIHGNVDALDAVLREVAAEAPDAIVVCGDVAAGPFPEETAARVRGLPNARFVRGNGDRQLAVASLDDPDTAWFAERLSDATREFLAGFAPTLVLESGGLGKVRFCHGSPRSDEEIVTSLTPEHALATLLAGVDEHVVVSGHTHVQFDRGAAGHRLLNPGSVGMPYQGRPGAFWMLIGDDVEFRCTPYDIRAACERIRASDYPDAANLTDEILLTPPDPNEVETYFEQVAAGRGEPR